MNLPDNGSPQMSTAKEHSSRPLKILGKNRYELYISFGLVAFAVWLAVQQWDSYVFYVLMLSSFVLGFVCALNAFLDRARMGHVERFVTIIWYSILIFIMSLVFLEFLDLGRFTF